MCIVSFAVLFYSRSIVEGMLRDKIVFSVLVVRPSGPVDNHHNYQSASIHYCPPELLVALLLCFGTNHQRVGNPVGVLLASGGMEAAWGKGFTQHATPSCVAVYCCPNGPVPCFVNTVYCCSPVSCLCVVLSLSP